MKLFHFLKKHLKGVLGQIMAYFSLYLAATKLTDYLEEYLAEASSSPSTLHHYYTLSNIILPKVMSFMEEGGERGVTGSIPNTTATQKVFNITSLIAARSSWARTGLDKKLSQQLLRRWLCRKGTWSKDNEIVPVIPGRAWLSG